MIRHIVFFRLQGEPEGMQRQVLLETVKSKLEELPALIQEIRSFEVGINIVRDPGSADLSLVAVFGSLDELLAYRNHPAHQAFLAWNKEVCPKFAVIDYPV